jgi:hypothetical protein
MAAIVTDQFRILNAENFIKSIEDTSNSYYVFVGLSNPKSPDDSYRSTDWDTNTPSPTDNFKYSNFVGNVMMYGKRVTSTNARRVVRRIDWERGKKYEMYRHDYSVSNPSPVNSSVRLYDSNYYVMNSEYKVYICISNGSSGILTTGKDSLDEPTFTDLEPSSAGTSNDGYIWKYLFTVSPSDIVKFDSTEYISLPNNWSSSTNAQIKAVRDNADSDVNLNQIKKVYIHNRGSGYATGDHTLNIVGDGSGGKVVVSVDTSGYITNTTVTSGGSGYTFAMVDLGPISNSVSVRANLIPIIPPAKGHGYDIYRELGADKVLVYSRFDDSTRDFPVSTNLSQIGIVKNPTSFGSTAVFTSNNFSSLGSIKFDSSITDTLSIGDVIRQDVFAGTGSTVGQAKAYVASWDAETKVAKYFQDSSLFLNQSSYDTTDYAGVSTDAKLYAFESTAEKIEKSGFSHSVSVAFTGSTTTINNKVISLGSQFTSGLSSPEINKGSGDIIYLDNRPEISRNSRQKEDVKIILEF